MNPQHPQWLSFVKDGIVYDNDETGVGAVTAARHAGRYGFVVMMRPSTFLSLTPQLTVSEKPAKLVDFIAGGGAIGTPFLSVDPSSDRTRIRKHEGRHRMFAISRIAGDAEIPVAVLLDRDYRASDIDGDFVDLLRRGAWSEGKGSPSVFVEGPLFGDAWLNGEHLTQDMPGPPGP